MQKTLIKFQAALFGSFNFPADTDTTVRLMEEFTPRGFMPQVLSAPDPVSGAVSQRMSLIRGLEMQIVFSPDRIDFVVAMPKYPFNDFLREVLGCVEILKKWALRFNRVALVVDSHFEESLEGDFELLRGKILPGSREGSIEWMARWVSPTVLRGENYNICFEAMRAQGLMMVNNGRMQSLNGVKVMNDVSTTPHNSNYRFDCDNVASEFEFISEVISDQAKLIYD